MPALSLRTRRAFFGLLVGGVTIVALFLARSSRTTPPDRLRALARRSLARIDGDEAVHGLREPVEVIRDRWGVPHIYARNDDDLFFAQGYVMAQDRLWQLEMWRRLREGRLAEIVGPAAFERDRLARLVKYRGPVDDREWSSYHPDARRIVGAFVDGLNAFIARNKDHLPVEFELTGLRPEPWTRETALLRSWTFGDATNELQLARSVAKYGIKEANRRRAPDPWDDLVVPDGIDLAAIGEEVLASMQTAKGPPPKPPITEPYATWVNELEPSTDGSVDAPGSNAWVVAGARSVTGKPVIANDPHREVTNPSVRYIVHLNAPGWNVIGASEPPFIGVAVGHNERVGWGLTIVGIDQHDVYVEELNPDNRDEVRWHDGWEPMRIVHDEIAIRGEPARRVELKYTRHGPVFHVDVKSGRAYVVRSVLAEPGTAAYLGALRLAQARDCGAFLDAARSWTVPSENLMCGDVDGNIAWQAAGLAPSRKGWVGRLPVPGTGQYEWDGFRTDLPRSLNPERGYLATANDNINPKGYWPPIVFKRSSSVPFDRITRIRQMLDEKARFTIEDHERMQNDAYSLKAAFDQALFRGWTAEEREVEHARDVVATWNAVLVKDSVAAAIYTTWKSVVPEDALDGDPSQEVKRSVVESGLIKAIAKLKAERGPDSNAWRYGTIHRRDFPHPLVRAFDLDTVERSGGEGTVAADGATYREILDVADWDRSVATNVPGQSAQPESPFERNLLPVWTEGGYFPMLFGRSRIDAEAAHHLALRPAPGSPR
jgi:penicillin G amidase